MNDKILVPLDGSKYADKALDWALDLAEKYGSSIELLTIIPLTETFMTGTYSKPGKVPLLGPSVAELKERAKKLLDDTLQRVKKTHSYLQISTRILDGSPAEKIVETAKEGDFDLIVMGNRGLGRAKQFFLGSVSDKVDNEATCTVVIVK